MPKFEFRGQTAKDAERFRDLGEWQAQARSALQNHTAHITKLKVLVEKAATKHELLALAEHTQKFALNTELVALYDKVVPPV